MANITVIKRDGTKEPFQVEKIISAIEKALKATGEHIPKDKIKEIEDYYKELPGDTISVEEIQDKVELFLIYFGCYTTVKAYIKYREKHRELREFANRKLEFIQRYIESDNTANATIDDNSNVANHNIAVLNSEIHKEENAEINLNIWENKIKELYPDFNYKQLRADASTICYLHDLSSQIGMPYCVATSLYPFLLNGLEKIGGLSAAPKNIDSFCGMFVNLVFAIASQYKGAVATPGVLLCMDYFLRKEWGDEYYLKPDTIISSDYCIRKQTIHKQIHQYFQQICYTLMQPSGSRGNQSVFWNLSIFDKEFFNTMYEDFKFPDGSAPIWESLNWLQKDFLHWLNQERLKCILTFPVVSGCLIYKDDKFVDEELADYFAQEYTEGNSFFTYISDSADSLSSCCRLSSKISKPQFTFTNGQLSEMTGSKNVITLNLSRIIQDCDRAYGIKQHGSWQDNTTFIVEYLKKILDRVYKYQTAYNECLKDLQKAHLLSVYDAGFIDMKKQYLTIGINGLNQAAEYLDIDCTPNMEYAHFCELIFSTIKEQNTLHKTKELMFNTECTPCESASIKLYNRDKKDGYWVPSDTNLYASYIFKPNDARITVLDRIIMHGEHYIGEFLDGGWLRWAS
jgi:ribonucleoside-triphosphate reductase (formate)